MKTIGLIGCSGFVGSHLIERLLSTNEYKLFGIDLVSDKIEHLLGNSLFTFTQSNINDFANLDQWVDRCDIIISLAAICNPAQYNTEPLSVIESNFLHPLESVKLCTEKKKRFIHFSTSEVYGKTKQGIIGDELKDKNHESHYLLSEDTTPLIMGAISAQRWSYASAKQLMERMIYAYGKEKGLDYTIIRPFNFIGSRMDYIPGIDGEGTPRVLACFMDALLFNKPVQLVDGGKNKRVFTDIEDAINAIMKVIEKPDESRQQIFNIGNPDNEITIKELAEQMVSVYYSIKKDNNATHEIKVISSLEFYGEGYEDSDRRVPDITKAKTLLGWKPKINLKKSLHKTIFAWIEYYGKECAA